MPDRSVFLLHAELGSDATTLQLQSPFPDNYYGPPFTLISRQRINFFVNICKGLFFFYNEDDDSVIWNPNTNEAKIIPPSLDIPIPPRVRSNPNRVATGNIAFSFLGYDSKSSDFKIIRIIQHEKMGDDEEEVKQDCGCLPFRGFIRQAELYSFKTDAWTPISDAPPYISTHPFAYVNECFYGCEPGPRDGTIYYNIHCFDFCEETFSFFSSSQISLSLDHSYWITPLKFLDSLAILAEKGSPSGTHKCFEVWRMIEDDYSRWYKVFDVRVELYSVGTGLSDIIPLGSFMKDGHDVLMFTRLSCGEIIIYDWVTREMKMIGIIDLERYDVYRTLLISCDTYEDLLKRKQKHRLERMKQKMEIMSTRGKIIKKGLGTSRG